MSYDTLRAESHMLVLLASFIFLKQILASFMKASKSMHTYISLELVYTHVRVHKYVRRDGSTRVRSGPRMIIGPPK